MPAAAGLAMGNPGMALAAITAATGAASYKLAKMASDQTEAVNLLGVTFGKSSDSVAKSIDEIVETARQLRPDIQIISRARDAAHARHLYGVGVTDAVPETIEASLQLSEAALVGLGIPAGPVIATIHERRDAFRAELQKAALSAGRPVGHTFRARKAEARGGDRPPDGATAATPTTPAGGAASTAARKGPGTV